MAGIYIAVKVQLLFLCACYGEQPIVGTLLLRYRKGIDIPMLEKIPVQPPWGVAQIAYLG